MMSNAKVQTGPVATPRAGSPQAAPQGRGRAAAAVAASGFKVPRLRLLPIVIFTAVLMLSVRLGGLWQDFALMMASVEVGGAQAQAQGEPGEAPHPAPAVTRMQPPLRPIQGVAEQVAQAGGPESSDAVTFGSPSNPGVDPLKDPLNFTQSEIDLLQKLAERRELIETRSQELEQREALLTAAEGRIDRKIGELQTLQSTIADLLRQHDEQEEKKIAQLVKIYATMKPKDAARIFNDLDMPILLTVLENMKEASSAPIFAAMEADKARLVTEKLSTRRRIPVPGGGDGG